MNRESFCAPRSDNTEAYWRRKSSRSFGHAGRAQIHAVRDEFPWLRDDDANVLCESGGKAYRLIFAGGRANASLAEELGRRLEGKVSSDNFCIQVGAGAHLGAVARAIESLRGVDPRQIVPSVSEDALQGLKFSVCLPPHVASEVVRARFADGPGVAQVIERRPRVVIEGITSNRGSDSINSRYGQTQGVA